MTAELHTRRNVLTTGAAVAGAAVGAVALTACGSDSPSSSGTSSSGAAAGGAAGTAVAALSEITVGQAKSVKVNGQDAIVARPTETTAVCFSAICPHQGGIVAPDGSQLKCPLHASTFNTLTGEVTKGPAKTGLSAISVKVDGDNVVTA